LKGRGEEDRLFDVDGRRKGIHEKVRLALKSGYLSPISSPISSHRVVLPGKEKARRLSAMTVEINVHFPLNILKLIIMNRPQYF